MAGKKLYWLKLKTDYFDSIKMKKLRQMAGGAVFTLIYLKMQLLALKSDGIIVFEKVEDSFAKELALQLDEAVEDIEMTLLYLQKVDLIDVNQDCDTYFLPEVIANTGSESESAERVRKHRNKINSLHCNNEVTESNLLETSSNKTVTTEKDIRVKRIEKDKSVDPEAEEEGVGEEESKGVMYDRSYGSPAQFIAAMSRNGRYTS